MSVRRTITIILATCLAGPGRPLAQVLQPTTYRSASGQYELHVDPSSPRGGGSAVYRMTREGQVRWTITHPFTIRDTHVSADGSAAGYGYSWEPGASIELPGEFLVAVLGPDGQVRKLHSKKQKLSTFMHTPPSPVGIGLLMQESCDRFVVRVEDDDVNRQSEEWWFFKLSTGELVSKLRPKDQQENREELRYVLAAVPVLDTPLFLVQWYQYGSDRFGTRFAVVDEQCQPVWVLDLPDDYTREDSDRSYGMLQEVGKQEYGAIMRWDEPRRFDLCLVKEWQRVAYGVSRDAGGKWRVQEDARRSNSVEEGAANPSKAAPAPTVTAEVALLGTIELDPCKEPLPEVRDVGAFTFDGSGNIAFLQWQRDPWGLELVYVDAGGKLLGKHPIPFFREGFVSDIAWLGEDQFAVEWSPSHRQEDKPATVFTMSGRSGAIRVFVENVGDTIHSLAAFTDGRLAVLGDNRLDVFDRQGQRLWRLTSEDGLCGASDVAVLQDGRIALLDSNSEGVQFVEAAGTLGRYDRLRELWSRESRYPCALEADFGGGMIVEDANHVVLMDARGKRTGDLELRYADGRKVDLRQPVRAGPDGKRWTSDSFSILRLDADGRVDRIVGEGPGTTRLGKAAAVRLGRNDEIYAVAERTGQVFLIDPDGRLVRVLNPDPTDFSRRLVFASVSMTVDDDGGVFLGSEEDDDLLGVRSFVHGGPDGRRVGVEHLGLDSISERWLVQPRTKNRWVLGRKGGWLVDPKGDRLANLERRPDGTWLGDPGEACVAPDGSIAILCRSTRRQDPAMEIVVYAADGSPSRQIRVETGDESPGYLAYDGARAVVILGDRLRVFATAGDAPPRDFRLIGVDPESTDYWTPLLPRGREEVWLFDGRHTIRRYPLARN